MNNHTNVSQQSGLLTNFNSLENSSNPMYNFHCISPEQPSNFQCTPQEQQHLTFIAVLNNKDQHAIFIFKGIFIQPPILKNIFNKDVFVLRLLMNYQMSNLNLM
jgi:hypothetical protein